MISPCTDCNDRWVRDGDRCHSSCDRYKEWRHSLDLINELKNKERNDNKQSVERRQKYLKEFKSERAKKKKM